MKELSGPRLPRRVIASEIAALQPFRSKLQIMGVREDCDFAYFNPTMCAGVTSTLDSPVLLVYTMWKFSDIEQ